MTVEELVANNARKKKKKKNEILAKTANVTKPTTQQSNIGFLYYSTALFFGAIWFFPRNERLPALLQGFRGCVKALVCFKWWKFLLFFFVHVTNTLAPIYF
jgi:hypothetical protein